MQKWDQANKGKQFYRFETFLKSFTAQEKIQSAFKIFMLQKLQELRWKELPQSARWTSPGKF